MHPGASFCQAVRCDWTGYPIYKFATLTDGLQPVGNLAFDQAGNVYGTTESGGTGQCVNGCGIVFQLTRSGSGWTKTTLYNFQGGGAVSPASGVINRSLRRALWHHRSGRSVQQGNDFSAEAFRIGVDVHPDLQLPQWS